MRINRPSSKQPIPVSAEKVFSGDMFDVYQWKQELYNGEYTTFEKLKRSDTVSVLPVTKEGKIIISRQEQPGTEPFYGVLGGRIDEGEDPLTAAKRELIEEAGMESDDLMLWDAAQPIEKIDWVIYLFIARDCRKVQDQSPDAGEKIELLYVDFDEFIQYARRPDFRDSEISLKLFRIANDNEKLKKLKKLLFKQ